MSIAREVERRMPAGVRTTRAVGWLSCTVAGLAVIASGAGLFSRGGDGRTAVTSIRGEDIQLHGVGLYRHDTVFIAEGSRGTDLVTLVLAVPLLLTAFVLYRRRSARGGLLLAGALTYVVYVYASRSLFNAYNSLFLLYVAVFSASLFAVLRTASSIDLAGIGSRLSAGSLCRGLAAPPSWPPAASRRRPSGSDASTAAPLRRG
jgi:hypothetical protein